uniref:Cyclic nucleotide-binding domain-containing protein n=1 Tax=Desulfobacca acetoxidans TaxID=60893 RepID=A0A7V6DNX5_9BACT
MENLEALLAAHQFFKGMTPQHLAAVAACGRWEQFTAGDFLCRETEEAKDFFVILSGSVSVEIFSFRRGPLTTGTVEEGEVLGWLWLDKPFHWHLDARARQVTRVVALKVKDLMQRCEADHDLGYELMKRYALHLAVQFRITKLQLVDMYGT